METFPILAESEENEEFSQILGYQVVDTKGKIIARGETPAEAEQNAIAVLYPLEYPISAFKKAKSKQRISIGKAI